jgi:hypothetical protein
MMGLHFAYGGLDVGSMVCVTECSEILPNLA